MEIQISSFVASNLFIRLWNVAVLFITLPTIEFTPTSTQPELSCAVFPTCIRTPSKPGTPINRGSLPSYGFAHDLSLKRKETVSMSTLYLPVGIAVCPYTFISLILCSGISWERPLSLSSIVSQKPSPSMESFPIVQVSFLAIRLSSSSMIRCLKFHLTHCCRKDRKKSLHLPIRVRQNPRVTGSLFRQHFFLRGWAEQFHVPYTILLLL